MSVPLLTARGLVKEFAGRGGLLRPRPVRAVTDFDFELGVGEAVGLVGESGSGKSTIGRMLLGLTPPTRGVVTFDGNEVGAASSAARRRLRRRMQLIFQDPYSSLDPRRRVGAQIADGIEVHGLARGSAVTARVNLLLEQVGLSADAAGRFPHEFSGGQRQRVSIARALATEPDFIVADEPVSALDVSIQAQIVRLLYDLGRSLHLSMLFISHDLPVVRALCDRIVVLYLGRVMEEGPAAAIFARPRHPYTRALISCAPSFDTAKRSERVLLSGDPPSPANPPSGCVFRTRCPSAIAACAEVVPPLVACDDGHRVACIRATDDETPTAAS
jgi:peptide/nickel transport system ATP-binding protein